MPGRWQGSERVAATGSHGEGSVTPAPGQRARAAPELLLPTGRRIARNALLNAIGQAVPLVVGVVTIPFIVRGLGPDRFGLLSIAWVVMGYFTLFDLGLGRATTKFVAELLGQGLEEDVPRVIWTSALSQVALGLLGTLTFTLVTPLLVERVLRIPEALVNEALWTFYVLAWGVPVTLISGALFGALEARQRFDLVNAIRAPSSAMIFLLPVAGIGLGITLPGIVLLILCGRVLALAMLSFANWRLTSGPARTGISLGLLKRLLGFGGWVMVSNVVGPVLVYLDRFLIGSLVSIAAVGYYAAPYEAVTRLWIIPASLTSVLFPTFSLLQGAANDEKISTLFLRSLKFQIAILFPIILTIIVFAREGMTVWLGETFAHKSTLVLQILAIGVFVNSLSNVPFALLQALGRPDLTAKFHLLELPVYGVMAFVLVRELGITGAALAWTLRVTLDGILLFGAALRSARFPKLGQWVRRVAGGMVAVALGALLLGVAKRALLGEVPAGWHILPLGGSFVVLLGLAWGTILDKDDRKLAMALVTAK